MTDTVPDMVCVTCLRPANRLTLRGKSWWGHSPSGDDHEVVAVPRAEMTKVEYRCDFCCVPGVPVTWAYYTNAELRQIAAIQTKTSEVERRQFSGNRFTGGWENVKSKPGVAIEKRHDVLARGWTACDPCAELIELRDVNRLATRARRLGPPPMGQAPHSHYRKLWEPFFRDISHRVRMTHSSAEEAADDVDDGGEDVKQHDSPPEQQKGVHDGANDVQ